MYLISFIILVISGFVSLIHILFGIKDQGEGIKLFVNIAEMLFWASLLFLIVKGVKKKD
ncbi:hypothetical protein [Paenibacillus faecalis]|uniref:hypothetical protein n=1 Tax=Paenibacillus faecalis TaxID=2079532 RepID=UPI00131A51DC|nr:hypothetical protein [Paenibacillus faecalis]